MWASYIALSSLLLEVRVILCVYVMGQMMVIGGLLYTFEITWMAMVEVKRVLWFSFLEWPLIKYDGSCALQRFVYLWNYVYTEG